ncbi:hypothetical protein [Mucilaginibacter ginsenosidivorans]|uniref:Uncharacterized protein n=1 Tax=Mucilaginibacter ginsenosidivorans TaxID=398053 RepID=A0A5B8UZ34_9SPHI|nr:hypothetical protein [Mucilaginibacter ginsenosidivorans]QEC64005.1 hypothetical protein FRZ54_15955 [Mucilaginibacter ginsenosidivorans]
MERRAFVRLSAYTALVLAIPLADGCKTNPNDPLSQPFLFSRIADIKTLREAGMAYRKLAPHENDPTSLRQLLSEGKPTTDAKLLTTLLNRQVKQDFASAKVITVAGWVLSVTEARQCALFSILNT